MKSLLSFFLMMSLGVTLGAQDNEDLVAIEAAVANFAAFGDQQNVAGLEGLLHPQFRAVVNRLFGSEEVSLMDKTVYLELIKTGKIGGDQRTVHLLEVEVVANNAHVKALFVGEKLRFTTFISLVKNPAGEWQVISDFPHIEQV